MFDSKKFINEVFILKEKEYKKWANLSFIGGHHWENRNYIGMIGYPFLFVIFIITISLFSVELVSNIMNLQNKAMDSIEMLSNPNFIEENLLQKVIPYNLFYISILSISTIIVWSLYDLRVKEKKYEKLLSENINYKNQKSVFTVYILLTLIGTLGAHRFYMGQFNSGLCMLFCSLMSWTGILGVVVIFWFMCDLLTYYKKVLQRNRRILRKINT